MFQFLSILSSETAFIEFDVEILLSKGSKDFSEMVYVVVVYFSIEKYVIYVNNEKSVYENPEDVDHFIY